MMGMENRRGLKELNQGVATDQRLRWPGGGRKRLTDTDPWLVSDLLSLIEPATLGDPERPLIGNHPLTGAKLETRISKLLY
jgi:hypothetical protein